MAQGDSGKVVIEVDPEFKKDLYKVLRLKDLTMKDWFVQQAEEFMENADQLILFPKSKTEKVNE
ncbi:MAG: hypothetical protein RIC80_00405 [Cyclobacteriaceae bacterium]